MVDVDLQILHEILSALFLMCKIRNISSKQSTANLLHFLLWKWYQFFEQVHQIQSLNPESTNPELFHKICCLFYLTCSNRNFVWESKSVHIKKFVYWKKNHSISWKNSEFVNSGLGVWSDEPHLWTSMTKKNEFFPFTSRWVATFEILTRQADKSRYSKRGLKPWKENTKKLVPWSNILFNSGM